MVYVNSCIVWILIIVLVVEKTTGHEIDSDICGFRTPHFDLGRIVNGKVAKTGHWPWQVLVMRNGKHECGGSLIDKQWILTAAHCIKSDIKAYTFFVGARHIDASGNNAREVKAHLFVCHKDFNTSTYANDLCLIKLTHPVRSRRTIRPICLPRPGAIVAVGDLAIATGWGRTEGTGGNSKLRQAELPVIDTEICRKWYRNHSMSIPEKHFCAGYKEGGTDTCDGDSGGPLMHIETSESGKTAYVLRGVTSFGKDCAKSEQPGVYVRVLEYLDWIEDEISGLSSNSCMPIQSSECGGNVDTAKTLRSPTETERTSYAYPHNTECTWNIVAPSGFWVKFTFICYFLLSPAGGVECADSLSITDESGAGTSFCGNELPKPFVVKGNVANLVFSTDMILEYPGFVMEVAFVTPTVPTTTDVETNQHGQRITPTTTTSTTTTPHAEIITSAGKKLSTHLDYTVWLVILSGIISVLPLGVG